MATDTKATEATFQHHVDAVLKGDVDATLEDYTEQSVLYLPSGPVRGLKALREFFEGFLANKPKGFPELFEITRLDFEGEMAYVVWKCGDSVLLGTDTFIVRDNKIFVQTFAAYLPS